MLLALKIAAVVVRSAITLAHQTAHFYFSVLYAQAVRGNAAHVLFLPPVSSATKTRVRFTSDCRESATRIAVDARNRATLLATISHPLLPGAELCFGAYHAVCKTIETTGSRVHVAFQYIPTSSALDNGAHTT